MEKIEIITGMNINKLVAAGALMVALALSTSSAMAITAAQVKSTKEAVLSVPVPEMPAKAAELVTAADSKDREAVAVTAVKAIVFKHRASAPVVVAAVSKAAPEVAAAVTAAASELASDQARTIARAAMKAAPGQADAISLVLSKIDTMTIAPSTRSYSSSEALVANISSASAQASVATPQRLSAAAGPQTGGTITTANGKNIDGSSSTSSDNTVTAPAPTPKDYTQPR